MSFSLLHHTAPAGFSSLLYDHHNLIVVLSPRPHCHGYVVFSSPSLPAQFLSSSFLSHRTAPIMLSSLLHNNHHRYLHGYVVVPSPPSSSPPQFLVVLPPHQEANVIFPALRRCHHNRVHQPTTVTGMLSSLLNHLHHNVFPSLPHFHGYLVYPPSPHRHDYVSSLFHHHHDQKTPEILLGRR